MINFNTDTEIELREAAREMRRQGFDENEIYTMLDLAREKGK